MKNFLIIGIAGGLAQLIVQRLLKEYPDCNIVGIDSRYIPFFDGRDDIKIIRMQYTRNQFEKVFREYIFDGVFHLARMTHSSNNYEERVSQNLIGTKRILDLSKRHYVKKIIVFSTYHVYGALHDNPMFLNEDSLLRASINHPELRDVVEMDQLATNWMWKNQNEIETIVFRPCNVIGSTIKNTMTTYLTTPYAPVCADFNPMFQFVHEEDMASICVRSLKDLPTGVYNVAGPDVIGLSKARDVLGMPSIPIPSFLLHASARLTRAVFWKFPEYLIDYIQYSCIIDNGLLLKELGEDIFDYSAKEALIRCQEDLS